MGISDVLKRPLLRREQTCERCGGEFACEIGLAGCWCTSVKLSEETLENMRGQYKECLCRRCLETLESDTAHNGR